LPPRLDRQGARPPVGPTSSYCQDSGKQQRAFAPRQRRCLLKGCEARFRAAHPLARYCSETCQQAARRWTLWRANRRYRRSAPGKTCRREQCRRRRERCRRLESRSTAGEAMREGYQEAAAEKNFSCSRPGCYECFTSDPRSPLKKFCNHVCRRALRHVLLREARWRRRFARAFRFPPPPFPRRC
jgi:hypothetical protein